MAPRKVLVFGGTGASGLITVEKALAAGLEVTVYVRTPSKLPASMTSNPNLRVVVGELTDADMLSKAIPGQDVIMSLLGPVGMTGPGDRFPKFYQLLFRLMREHHVRRIYALGTFSHYEPADESSVLRELLVWFIWTVMNHGWREYVGIGQVFSTEASDLDYTLFRVGFLWNGEGSGSEPAVGYIGDGRIMLHVRRAEIARWLVAEAQKDKSQWAQKLPGLSSDAKAKSG